MADTVYLGDKPNGNGRTGTLFLFKLESRNNAIIVSKNVGTIDYERAEILLKPINITGTSKNINNIPIIEVSACPRSNDVIGLQDLYLQLDVSNSTVDMVVDNITSGDNSAGTMYTATSSYTNGSLARLTEGEALNTTLTSSDTYMIGSTTTTPSLY